MILKYQKGNGDWTTALTSWPKLSAPTPSPLAVSPCTCLPELACKLTPLLLVPFPHLWFQRLNYFASCLSSPQLWAAKTGWQVFFRIFKIWILWVHSGSCLTANLDPVGLGRSHRLAILTGSQLILPNSKHILCGKSRLCPTLGCFMDRVKFYVYGDENGR